MAGYSPTRLVKSLFGITSPMFLKKIRSLSHLSAIILSSWECLGLNVSIPRLTGHPKRSSLLCFPHTTNPRSTFQNPHLSQLLNLRVIPSHENPNHLRHLQTPFRDHNPCLSRMNHAPRALSNLSQHPTLLKTPPHHPRPPRFNRGRSPAYQYHANQLPIADLIHSHKAHLQSP